MELNRSSITLIGKFADKATKPQKLFCSKYQSSLKYFVEGLPDGLSDDQVKEEIREKVKSLMGRSERLEKKKKEPEPNSIEPEQKINEDEEVLDLDESEIELRP
ncbi:hypothetical protein HN512_04505 [Candidatus Peregrinibacteria bacterium]|jgi:hypothetical protein|nr:hypothetical protein [Candidatus Peregrinibacteria bacterium]MBT3599068.1 hypothetical protein [Candidatus Peregrinibacteria bacterium]MBT4367697.1 hypothetical protein [Candidatus Peregrinibacteria bacterium]MBT4585617.1 hypothetical protein [Candidatus Peregrinibacteria bacterium]MBT6730374.1 hypothetical protein [Candidatus Peregrinibacteria bacterium]